MEVKKSNSKTSGQRFALYLENKNLTDVRPVKKLRKILTNHAGRDSKGQVSVRHHGGRQKRFWRQVDFKREKHGISARVASIEYDPNRGADIALLSYADG